MRKSFRPGPGRFTATVAAVALAVAFSSCGGGGEPRAIVVLAASSLSEPFAEIGRAFEAANSDTVVTFSFGPSNALASQAREGAPADLLATADQQTMASVGQARLASEPRSFARNSLAILVESGNPHEIAGLADLAQAGLIVVVCAVEVPCGRLAAEALASAGVELQPRGYEADVGAVVTKVLLGEADAGIVYSSNIATLVGRASAVPVDENADVTTTYAIAALTDSGSKARSDRFIEFVLSPEGQDILAQFGFRSA